MPKPKKMFSRRTPLIVLIGIILVGNFLVTSGISYRSATKILRRGLVTNVLPLTGGSIYSQIKLDLLPPIIISSQLAIDPYIREFISRGEEDKSKLVEYLHTVQNTHEFTTCFLVSELSRTYYTIDTYFDIHKDNPDAQWYFDFRDSGKEYEANITVNTDMDNMPTVFINYRIEDQNNNFLGITGIGLELDSLDRILEGYRENYDRHIYFINSEGKIIARSEGSFLKEESIHSISGIKEKAGQILSSQELLFEHTYNGTRMLASSRYIPELDWYVLVEQEEAAAFSRIQQGLLTNSLLSIGTILITLVLISAVISYYNKQLEVLASTDRLTGISNRHIFEFILGNVLAQRKRTGVDVSMLMIDIDHFKKLNDSLGHLAGDKILKETVEVIKETKRTSDNLSRWGGEEFVLLLQRCDLSQALSRAEDVRRAVEEASLARLPDNSVLTISIGASQIKDRDTIDSVVSRADKALYLAKEKGRNRVEYCT